MERNPGLTDLGARFADLDVEGVAKELIFPQPSSVSSCSARWAELVLVQSLLRDGHDRSRGLEPLHRIGADRVMWSSDYRHQESTSAIRAAPSRPCSTRRRWRTRRRSWPRPRLRSSTWPNADPRYAAFLRSGPANGGDSRSAGRRNGAMIWPMNPRRHRGRYAEHDGLPSARQVERTEQEIPERQRAGKVPIEALLRAGVMPAMERRTRNRITQGSVVPAQVRVNHDRIEGRERRVERDDGRIEAGHDQRDDNDQAPDHVVYRMQPDGRKPVELARRMVDRMERPQARAVEEAVLPIAQEIAGDENLDALQPERLGRDSPVTLHQRLEIPPARCRERKQREA